MASQWFLSELIFRIHDPKGEALNKFIKQLRLIKAETEKEAYQLALVRASQELDKLNNPPYKDMIWEFAGIGFIKNSNNEEEEKAEFLFDTIEEYPDASAYMDLLRVRNEVIQMQIALTA
jgi:hypothetical protein